MESIDNTGLVSVRLMETESTPLGGTLPGRAHSPTPDRRGSNRGVSNESPSVSSVPSIWRCLGQPDLFRSPPPTALPPSQRGGVDDQNQESLVLAYGFFSSKRISILAESFGKPKPESFLIDF